MEPHRWGKWLRLQERSRIGYPNRPRFHRSGTPHYGSGTLEFHQVLTVYEAVSDMTRRPQKRIRQPRNVLPDVFDAHLSGAAAGEISYVRQEHTMLFTRRAAVCQIKDWRTVRTGVCWSNVISDYQPCACRRLRGAFRSHVLNSLPAAAGTFTL